MARMFEAAESHEGAVLLLDEADSFLRSRRMAERNYEVSEVNEMLAGMERFAGIFICTTNLFEELDEAALRRFAFKIGFKPLRVEQRQRMFAREACGDAGGHAGHRSDQPFGRPGSADPGRLRGRAPAGGNLGRALSPDEFLSQLEAETASSPVCGRAAASASSTEVPAQRYQAVASSRHEPPASCPPADPPHPAARRRPALAKPPACPPSATAPSADKPKP